MELLPSMLLLWDAKKLMIALWWIMMECKKYGEITKNLSQTGIFRLKAQDLRKQCLRIYGKMLVNLYAIKNK